MTKWALLCIGGLLSDRLLDVEELDFAGPWEMVGMWGTHFGGVRRLMEVRE